MNELLGLFVALPETNQKPFTLRSIASSVNLKATNPVSVNKMSEKETPIFCLTDTAPSFYNPVFLHMRTNQNNLFVINREQYRNLSLAPPTVSFTKCYVHLIQ